VIICVVGPTGVGKTKLSVALAKKYNGIVINCDSMQVFKRLNIGTAKVTEEEKEGIPHYLFDIKEPTEEYTVYDYQKDLRKLIDEHKDKNIIIVGGTGLYLKAGLYDYRFSEEKTKIDYSHLSDDEVYELVLKKDPNTKIHKNNRVRLERFLNKENTEIVEPKKLYDHIIIGLTTSREKLYERINNRVDEMVANGLLEEVKKLYDENIKTKPLTGGIGYKELYAYFDGRSSLEEAIYKIKQNSRHYAKRQYTFFNNQLDVKWFEVNFNDFNKTIKEVEDYIEGENK
jgi:tRNA dimethylallyltransferase